MGNENNIIRVEVDTDNNAVKATATSASTTETRQKLLSSATKMMESMTTKSTIKDKLTSRKFWACAAGLITSIVGMIGLNDSIIAIISFAVLGVGSVVAYILTEGKIDVESTKKLIELISQIIDKINELDTAPATTTVSASGTDYSKVTNAVFTSSNIAQVYDKTTDKDEKKEEAKVDNSTENEFRSDSSNASSDAVPETGADTASDSANETVAEDTAKE